MLFFIFSLFRLLLFTYVCHVFFSLTQKNFFVTCFLHKVKFVSGRLNLYPFSFFQHIVYSTQRPANGMATIRHLLHS
ncbi:hypothetical protein BC940DRAFT_296782, partial [Gongronella butleri]